MSDELPFEIADKSERRSPLKQLKATQCDHEKAYTSDEFPAAGTRYICVDCGYGSTWPRDLRGDSDG